MDARIWCKTLRAENFWTETEPGEDYLLEEPVMRDSQSGEPLITNGGLPYGRPSWPVDQKVVLYVGGTSRLAALVRITSAPQESGTKDWPWHTQSTVLRISDDGPTLEEVGIPSEMVERRIRWRLDELQSRKALDAFGFQGS